FHALHIHPLHIHAVHIHFHSFVAFMAFAVLHSFLAAVFLFHIVHIHPIHVHTAHVHRGHIHAHSFHIPQGPRTQIGYGSFQPFSDSQCSASVTAAIQRFGKDGICFVLFWFHNNIIRFSDADTKFINGNGFYILPVGLNDSHF